MTGGSQPYDQVQPVPRGSSVGPLTGPPTPAEGLALFIVAIVLAGIGYSDWHAESVVHVSVVIEAKYREVLWDCFSPF